jgi:hypothetical protein
MDRTADCPPEETQAHTTRRQGMHGFGLSPRDAALLHARVRAEEGDAPSILARIRDRDVNLAIWNRRVSPALSTITAAAAALHIDETAHTTPDAARRFTRSFVRRFADPETAGIDSFAADLERLIRLYADATGEPKVKVRLESIHGPSCQFFHVDFVKVRLITAYAGAGTEFLPEHALDRTALGKRPDDICLDKSETRQLPRFAVGLFKGAGYPGNAETGIVHRSPAADAGRHRRLLFVIDAVRD